MSFSGLIAIGAVVGGLTLNPATLGSISGAGLALKTFSETKDYKRKIEMSKYNTLNNSSPIQQILNLINILLD